MAEELMIIPEDYAAVANVPSEIRVGSEQDFIMRAQGTLFGLNLTIRLLGDDEAWAEFSENLGSDVAQQKRVELFRDQFRASCVVTRLCHAAGVEVNI